ncbi:MAG: peptidase [Phormidesmis sp. CAN_BIN44]|nr:peptidase [Phormidesmis sp. CAN_BIN44]
MRAFRKYHRTLAIVLALPLFVTLLTGMAATIVSDWSIDMGISRSLLLKIHNGEIFNLRAIYPILNGVGLLGLIVTGLSMSSVFRQKDPRPRQS